MSKRWIVLGLVGIASAVAWGLWLNRTLPLPEGYVPVTTHHSAVERSGVSSRGNRFEVRRHDNLDGGTLEFWAEAVRRELVDVRGYASVGQTSVQTAEGVDGVELRLIVTRALETYAYVVTVLVDEDDVLVAEAGGDQEALEGDLEVLREAVAGLAM